MASGEERGILAKFLEAMGMQMPRGARFTYFYDEERLEMRSGMDGDGRSHVWRFFQDFPHSLFVLLGMED